MDTTELVKELIKCYPEGADKIQTYLNKILEFYDLGGLENIRTLVTVLGYSKKYGLTHKIEKGGTGWEPSSDSTTFGPLLGREVQKKYSSLEEYFADPEGRKALAEEIRNDCLQKVSTLIGLKVKK